MKNFWNRNYTCVFTANVAMVLSQFLVNPLVTTYARWLGAGTTLIGALTGLYFAVAFLIRPVSGPTITIVNHRLLLIATYVMGVIVNLMYAVFPSIPMFITARVLHGVEFAFLGSLLMVMASDSLTPEQLGPGLGMFSLGTAFGMAFGPSLGVAIRAWGVAVFGGEGGGYRMAFLAAMLTMLLALIPCFLVKSTPRDPEADRNRGKWYSNIIAVPAILPSLMQALIMMCNNLYTSYLIPYGEENGFARISLFFTFYAAGMLLSRPLVNRSMIRFGVRNVILPGLFFYAASFVIVSLAESVIAVYAAGFLAAIGFGTACPAMQTLCIQLSPPEKRAAASNTAYTGQDLGLFLGPLAGSLVLKALEGSDHAYASMYLAGVVPLILCALLCIVTNAIARKKAAASEAAS
jgi:MFS family permease